ncbi:YqjK family protein [Halomonas salifodinae]|uniref:YqjK family protein n=1 Tax=Halomonas salifodinae TaxID=438745 RepID=UPI0033BD6B95
MTRDERAAHKAALEARIEQQRIDLLVAAERWQGAGREVDGRWQELMRWKAALYGVGGLLIWRSAKRPASLVRVAKRVAAGALLLRRARRLLR